MDRDVVLKYLPDETPTNLAVFVAPDAKSAEVRKEIQEVAAGHRILIFSDRDLRTEAVRIFDRTFAITYALEAVAVIVAGVGGVGAWVARGVVPGRGMGVFLVFGPSAGQNLHKSFFAGALF